MGTVTIAPDPAVARGLIRSLHRGTALPEGASFIHVGHEEWLLAQAELLQEIAEDGYSDTKFVRGAYGSGKSHFLSVVQERARQEGWVTSHIECHFDRVEIDRFETLYPALVRKLAFRDILATANEGMDPVNPARQLLERWTERQFAAVGIKADIRMRAFDADDRLRDHLARKLLKGAVALPFARALTTFALATFFRDPEAQQSVCAWFSGAPETVSVPEHYVRKSTVSIGKSVPRSVRTFDLRPINAGTVHDAMGGLLWLVKDTGYAGLLVCIDEVEELARLRTQKRQDRALQALREYIDHAGGDHGFKWLCMYLAATPEMFDNQQYFPRYDALASRIQPVSEAISWRAPVIDLDKTPLGQPQLALMAGKIRNLYAAAHGADAVKQVTDEFLGNLVDEIGRTRLRIARPRLLSRIVVDELNRARSAGPAYTPPEKLESLLTSAASAIREAEKSEVKV